MKSNIESNELYFSPKVCFKVDDWTVVDPDDSVIPVRAPSGAMMVSQERERGRRRTWSFQLDVAVKAEKVVRIGDKNVTRYVTEDIDSIMSTIFYIAHL